MARQTVTHITDDLDGSKDAEQVTFAYNGSDYTIDLSKKNRAAFEKVLKPYIEAGQKVTRKRATSTKSGSTSRDLAAVREWAKSQGIDVSERGRIAASVLDQYDTAH